MEDQNAGLHVLNCELEKSLRTSQEEKQSLELAFELVFEKGVGQQESEDYPKDKKNNSLQESETRNTFTKPKKTARVNMKRTYSRSVIINSENYYEVLQECKLEEKEETLTNCINMIEGDVFEAPEASTLVHCVGADLLMSDGIAVKFKEKFVSEQHVMQTLLEQEKKQGEVILQNTTNRKVIHLVTKALSTMKKPSWGDFKNAVKNLKQICEKNGIHDLAMPKLGAGLDRLYWPSVKKLLNATFAGSNIKINVYYLPPKKEENFRSSLHSQSKKTAAESHVPKIFVVGDSHAKDMSQTIKEMATKNVETFAAVKPGMGFSKVVNDLHNLTNELSPNDQLVIIGGTNDIINVKNNRDTETFNQEAMKKVMSHGKTTNVLVVSIPKRMDKIYLNKKIEEVNGSIKKMIDIGIQEEPLLKDRVKFLDINLYIHPQHYRKDGIHLSSTGKQILSYLILDNLKKY